MTALVSQLNRSQFSLDWLGLWTWKRKQVETLALDGVLLCMVDDHDIINCIYGNKSNNKNSIFDLQEENWKVDWPTHENVDVLFILSH